MRGTQRIPPLSTRPKFWKRLESAQIRNQKSQREGEEQCKMERNGLERCAELKEYEQCMMVMNQLINRSGAYPLISINP
jgi:hypothetical protein